MLHGLEGPKGASEDDGAKTLKNHGFLGGSGAQVAKTVRVLHGLEGPKGASEGGGAETLKNHRFWRGSGAQVAKTVRVLHGWRVLAGPQGGGTQTNRVALLLRNCVRVARNFRKWLKRLSFERGEGGMREAIIYL